MATVATPETLCFTIPGRPVPQGSKNRGRFGQTYDQAGQRLKAWREAVAYTARQAAIEAGNWPEACRRPIGVHITFAFDRPAAHYVGNLKTSRSRDRMELKPDAPGRFHTQTPDADKLCRALFDALTISSLIEDDSQLQIMGARKVWTMTGDHTIVKMRALQDTWPEA